MDNPTNLVLAVYISFCLCLAGCDRQSVGGEQPAVDAAAELDTPGFEKLLYRVAEGWNEGDARKAADCFATDAVYIEPPDRQLYRGREALYEFFGGISGRASPMTMTWHHLLFDETRQNRGR
jgi:hypothetical protein